MELYKNYSPKKLRDRLKPLMQTICEQSSREELKELGAKHPKEGKMGALTILDIILTDHYLHGTGEHETGFDQKMVWDLAREVERNISNYLYGSTNKPYDQKTTNVVDITRDFVMDNDITFARHVYKNEAFEQSQNELAHHFENERILENPYRLNRCYQTTEPVCLGDSNIDVHMNMDVNPVDCFEGLHCVREAWVDISIKPVGKKYAIHRFSCVYCPNSYGQLQLVVFDCEVETFTNGVIVQDKEGTIQVSIGNGLCVMELKPATMKDEDDASK